jgi:holin-like protein
MVRGLAILLALQFVGEVLSRALEVPIPGNVIGMGLLLGALGLGWVRLEWVQEAADLLLAHFALFFVPAGVGVMVYFELIAREWLAISVALVVSTFAVMAATGWAEAWLEQRGRRHGD